jgi:hypothetical protein
MIRVFDIGNHVECDICSTDYTCSDAIGGFIFSGKGVCPKCSEKFMASVKEYHEEKYIKAVAGSNETFRDFILRMRNGNNLITLHILE